MKVATFHNRVERREFTFAKADVEKALQEYLVSRSLLSPKRPTGAVHESWSLDSDTDENGALFVVTLTQQFEYLGDRVAEGDNRPTEKPADVRGTESTG